MALQTTFNRLKREVGIKRCVILDGNVGDVYLNDKKQIVDLKQYLTDMLKGMEYDDVLYWDRIDGIDGDVSRLSVIDEVEVEGDAYSFDDDEENQPQTKEKTGSGKRGAHFFKAVVIRNVYERPVIQPRSSHCLFLYGKTQRLHQMQHGVGGCAGSGDVSGIWRYLRFY